MMRTMLAAVLGAAFLRGADAVPAQNLYSSVEITTTHALGSALSSSTHHDLLGAFEASVASAVGAEYEHDVSVTISGTEHRRLQAGSSSLTITYVVCCGNSCDSVSAYLTNIATDPTAGTAHAAAIIDAINTAAAGSGFGNSVVASSAADVASTLSAPETVSISLPPAPAPGGGGAGPCGATAYGCQAISFGQVDYETRMSTYRIPSDGTASVEAAMEVWNSLDAGGAYCTATLDAATGMSNQDACGGSNTNIAFHYVIPKPH